MTKKNPPKQDQAHSDSKPKTLFSKRVFLISAGSLLLILVAITVYAFAYTNRFPPHTKLAGVRIGGLTKIEAQTTLEQAENEFLAQPLTLTYQQKKWPVQPTDLGINIDIEKALDTVWIQEKSTPWYQQLGQLLSSLFITSSMDTDLVSMSEDGESYFKKNVLAQIETPYEETSLSFAPGNVQVVPGKAGQRLQKDRFMESVYTAFANYNIGKYCASCQGSFEAGLQLEPFQPLVLPAQAEATKLRAEALLAGNWKVPLGSGKDTVLEAQELASWLKTDVARDESGTVTGLDILLREEPVKEKLTTWAASIKQNPVNARVASDGSGIKVAEEGKNGLYLDESESLRRISEQIKDSTVGTNRSLAVQVTVLQPPVRSDTLASLGIKELIGTATTDFTGSPNNRKVNIGVGQRSLDRLLVADGTVFSTTTALGPVDGSTGYLEELVIKGNRTIPEFGGGLCQVSTTLFRSVLNAGLPVVERTNHAYRVGYYERGVGPGLDATVYIPNPDFKWRNDTGKAVFIQSFVKGNTITFELYGSKDGRVASIGRPQIIETYPVGPPIYTETDTLAKGVTKQIETPHDGAKTQVEYRVTRDGKEIYKRVFISVYKAWPAQYLVGTKVDPNAAPSPTPTPEATPTPTVTPTVQ